MRTIILLIAALALLPFTTVDGRADGAWCARDSKGGTNCGFHSYEQCKTNISGIGGYCERNLFYRRPR
jgi:hypothetical protein